MSTPARPDASHGWRIGSLAGTPVYLGRSWPIIAVLIVVVFGPNLSRPDRGAAYGYLLASAYALLLLVSVLVHEAAHALAARWRGHPVSRIVADVWGGHTVYDATRTSPSTTAIVAVVGPLSNLALAAVVWGLRALTTNETTLTLLGIVAFANVLVGVFNLLPGLPLDGGQIVSALVWRATGSKGRGLVTAGWLGRVVAVLTVGWFALRPLAEDRSPDIFDLVWPFAIAFFLWQGATGAVRAGHIHEATAGRATDVLEPLSLVAGTATVSEVETAVAAGAWVAAADPTGWPLGVVDADSAAGVPADSRSRTAIASVTLAQPASWVVALPDDAVLTDLIRVMSERELSLAVVVDEATRDIRGLASAERINAVVGAELSRRGRR
ncbi:site-2 protease family protein [Terrabacter sp. Ter38]|uniref:site-2 protease family protein n=1 Tax=Terrabacter sp. Ter38 TaxID=2926030 RepID=UPI002119858D|nr:site-2 protease family protein [Terrabacter sp. Ter38]